MHTDAEKRDVLLELEKHQMGLFHVQAVAAFRAQWDAALVGNLMPRKETILRPRGYEVDALFSRLLSDLLVDSVDVLRDEALQMLNVVKG